MATLYAKTAGGNWSAAGTWSTVNAGGGDSSGPPTAADNVIFELLSGNVTVDVNSVCRSLDVTSGTGTYTGTITGTASVTLSIGDGTAGPGNVALKLDAGMTFTRSATSFTLSFVSTSATQQTILTAGKTMGGMTWNGVGGSWLLSDSLTASTAVLTLTNGTLDTGGQTISSGSFSSNNSNVRTLTLGASSLTFSLFPNAWLVVSTNLTFSAASSTINLSTAGDQSLNGPGLTYGTVVFGGSWSTTTAKAIVGAVTIGTLTITGDAAKTNQLTMSGTVTVTGTLNINGNSATNRVLIAGTTLGTAITITNNAATTSITNADFRDITGAGSASWNLSAITGGSGDCQGNSGITFTTATTRYWVGGTGNWADTSEWSATSGGGSGASVPLPQDDVVFDANSFSGASQTVTQNMPRLGKNVNWTGATNSPTWTINTTNQRIYGSLTLVSAMSITQSQVLLFEGRGSMTLTSAGKQFPSVVTLAMIGGTMTLQDALSSAATFNLNNGTFDSNGFSVTVLAFVSNTANARTLTMGASNWTLTGAIATVWNVVTSMTLTGGVTGVISITDSSSTDKLFLGGGKTYNDLTITGGGSGIVTVQNSNTFRVVTINAPKTVKLFSGNTQTIKRLIAMGASGSVITISSSTGASAATLSQAGGVTAGDWLSIQDITFSPSAAATFYAGANSTNVSGNTGITFKQLTAMNAGIP